MKNNTLTAGLNKPILLLILLGAWMGVCTQSAAFTLLFPDARSAAMGATGVATDPRNSVFYNPALLATAYEDYNWYAMLPAYHQVISDPDNLDSSLNTFLDAANALFNNRNPQNANTTEAALLAMDDKFYREREATTVMLGVPSVVLAGAFYISKYQVFTARPSIGNPDFSDLDNVNYDSTLDYRGVKILEMGFSSALPFTSRWLGDYKLGATLKLQFLDGLGYSENVALASLDFNDQGAVDKTSTFNFDVGFSKEIGVWNFGLAAQNLVKQDVNLGDSEETFGFEPLVRAGVAYRSRKTYFEVDADLTQSQQLGMSEKSQFVAAGWEYRMLNWFFLRAGAQQDLGGNNLTTFSYGLGVNIFGFQLDAAGTTNEEEEGLYAQLTLKI